ncbi:MAG: hypothetical protein ACK4WH_09910 [Phycisphaerales bacterium]
MKPSEWTRSCVFVALAAVIAGCSTPSINPIYTEDYAEVVKDDRIVGLWASTDDKKGQDRYRIEPTEEPKAQGQREARPATDERKTVYRLTIEDHAGNPKKQSAFELRLVRLGAGDYLDLYPTNSEVRQLGDRYAMAALPMHIIMPVDVNDDHAVVHPLDLHKVFNLLRESPGMTPHAVRDNDLVILTGSPRQVQEFYRRIGRGGELFEEPMEFKRIGDANHGRSLETKTPPDGPSAKPDRRRAPPVRRSRGRP